VYPKAYGSAQATLRTQGAMVLAIAVIASLVVGTQALSAPGPGGGTFPYNVSYQSMTGDEPGSSGSAPLSTTTDVKIALTATNLTNVTFTVSWTDNTISPFFNPTVTATVTGPNGTGTTTDRVANAGTDLTVTVPNEMPANSTVQAGSPEEALAKASAGNNATLGTGEWTVSLTVGKPLGPRPNGSISYTVDIKTEYFVGTAARV
jgi:hypothetical protein